MMIPSFGPAAEMFSELNRLQGALDSMFGPMQRSSIRAGSGAAFPVLNIGTTPDSVEVMAFAPGVDPSRLEITVDRGLLVIAGERRSELPGESDSSNTSSVYARERFSGAFRRVISLPEDVDAARVDASYRNGVLRVTVARRESSKPRRIEVN